MFFANFLVAASATMILPFLSLYIETFGHFEDGFVQRWSGYIFGVTFLIAFFVSPFWGRFGDRFGYKKILLLTGSGIATSIFLMSFVQTVYELFFLRMFMGLVTGFIPTSLALISAQTAKKHAGRTLGTLQMGTVSGGLFGPLFGGLLADQFGFAYTFYITAVVIYLAVLLVFLGIQESPLRTKVDEKTYYSRKEVLQHIFQHRILITVMFVTFLIQVGNFSIQPLLSLYVNELQGHARNTAFLAGLAFSATGAGNLLAARRWGSLGDRIGHEKVLIVLLALSALFFIPQALVTSLWQLVLFRFLFGLALGGIIPCITAYIRQTAPVSMQGEVLGYNVSFRFLGNVAGPVLGGIIASRFGISSVFYVTASLFLLSAFLLWKNYQYEEKSVAKAS
ncbi:MFS transporter [Metabacillus herbersteinensis]|uniref:MFS transporter n=1 Tax=Metabacillus herbersteinensis TaxID=283816 RepID=A0ABV6GBF7_9BACI